MSEFNFVFNRYEKKYAVTKKQRDMLFRLIGERIIPDEYGKSTVCSLYIDTPDSLLIRNSIDAVNYKEKIRLRSYGTPKDDSTVFLELKKKFDGVVYKRRVSMTLKQARDYFEKGIMPDDSQIMREIHYAMEFYSRPQPAIMIAYEREAFYIKNHPEMRITFDESIRFRKDDLKLESGSRGERIISDGMYMMELKTDGTMPLWLSHALDECEIRPTSFSKYGTAHVLNMCDNQKEKAS